jgi:F-type H+-transporting ATPase subunit delta
MIEPRTLARPYARAAFEFARGSEALNEWQAALDQLGAVAASEKVTAALKSPAMTAEQRVAVLTGLFSEQLPQAVVNFVRIMAENGRLSLLGEVAELFQELKQSLESAVSVDVISAFDVSDAEASALSDALNKQLERAVTMTYHTDPTLIGGAVIRAGDLVIDGSVRGRLEKLAGALTP